jgi:hypothetical protein
MNLKKRIISTALLLAVISLQAADRTDAEVNRALTKIGKLIKCSPYGKKPGTISLEEAGKKLRSGMILQLAPGHYNPMDLVIFNQDKIILEGDGSGGYVDVPIILYGRNCIIRNIKARSIEGESMIAANCVAHRFYVTSGNKRGKTIIANCAMNYMTIYPNAQDITIKNCTVLQGREVKDAGKTYQTATYTTHRAGIYSIINLGEMVKKGKLTFEDCILYSDGHIFSRENKLLTLTIENCIIFMKRSLVRVDIGKTGYKNLSAIKDKYVLKTKGKIDFVKPSFIKPPRPNAWWDIERDYFILTPKSPGYGKKIGVNMGPKGIPVTSTPGKKR